LLTGQIGKTGVGRFFAYGQPDNAMGGREVGGDGASLLAGNIGNWASPNTVKE